MAASVNLAPKPDRVLLLTALLCSMVPIALASTQGLVPPTLKSLPPPLVSFSNSTGARMECLADGHPPPEVTWLSSDGSPLLPITSLRQMDNNLLHLLPFEARQFRQDVHTTAYKCKAQNEVGAVVSYDINVKAVILQPYDVYVYDVFALHGNTAVFRCHVPTFLANHVSVTAWIRDNVLTIAAQNTAIDPKYTLMPTGELYVKNVGPEDAKTSFQCQTVNRLTEETKISTTAGKLFVTDSHNPVPTKITYSKKSLQAMAGDVSFLPCEAQGNPPPELKWQKKFDFVTKQIISSQRQTIQSGSLIIKESQLTDSGFYECVANNGAGNDKTVTELVIREKLSAIVEPPIAVVNGGQSATFNCRIQGSPVLSIHWLKDGILVSGNMFQITSPDNRTLRVQSFSPSLAGIYQCIVSNDFDASFGQALLKLGDISPSILARFEEQILHPGTSIDLKCIITGNPVPVISWSVDNMEVSLDKRITHTQSVDNNGSTISKLAIRHVKVEDGGLYKCQAVNKAGTVYHWARLNVYGNLAARHNVKILAVTGEQAAMHCPVYGYPFKHIVWENNDVELPVDVRQKVLENGSLFIENLYHGADSGVYKCTVQNDKGQKVTAEVKLTVMVPPKIAPFSFQEELVREGMRGRLQCVVLEGDLPLMINWLKDGKVIVNDQGIAVRNIDDFSSILTIAYISPRHNGNYTCQASNPAATVSFTTRLAVNVPPKILPFAFQDDQFFKGMRAHIICAVSQGDLPLQFQWLKDGKPIPSFLGVTARNYDGHANSLSIESVSSAHTGNYTCVVSNEAAAVSHTAQLLVYVTPKIIPFSFPALGVTEGVLARVSCVVYQGDLPLTINWLKDGTVVTDDSGINVRHIDEYSSILTIENTQRHHAGNYTCVARNAADTSRHSSSLLVHVPPKIVPFTFPADPLLEGMLVRVSCVVSRGDLPLTIKWYKDEFALPGSLASISIRDFDEYSSVLSIDPVSIAHSGNYKCVAQNHAAAVSHSAPLRVQVPPKWLEKPENTEVKSGENVFLHCRAEGLPKPEVTWSKLAGAQTQIPVRETSTFYLFSNGTMKITNISKIHEGKYFCTVSNKIGRPLSWGITVKVLAPPHFELKTVSVNGKRGENVTLSCLVMGDPPVNFEWMVDSHTINPSLNRRYQVIYSGDNESRLNIFWLDRKDSNSFICRVTNRFGSDEKVFLVKVQETPEATEIFTKIISGNRSVSLSWKAPFDGHNAIVKYIVQYKKEIDNWQLRATNMSVNGSTTSAVVSGLHPATTYHFRVAAENAVGISDFSTGVTGRTEDDIPAGSPQNVEVESMDQHTLRITWKPPRKSLWNGPIRGYNIGFKIEGRTEPYEISTLEVPEDYTEDLIYQLTDLKLFTLYKIIVLAYNSKGQGPASDPVIAMTSEDVPSSPPEDIRCSALSAKSIYLLWEPPATKTLHGILRGFKVLYKPVKEWYDSGIQVKVIQTTKVTLHELQVNTNYSFQVLAYTKVGDGTKSKPVYCKTHEDVPEAPEFIKVLPSSSDSVVVAWKSPKASNGAVTKYNIYYKSLAPGEEPNAGDTTSALMSEQVAQEPNAHVARAESQFFEVKGLKKDQKYAFWVTASSVIGEGQSSEVMAQTVAEAIVSAKSASFDDEIKTPWKRDVVMPCRSVGVPSPQRKWKIGSKDIELDGKRVVLSDGTLILNKVGSEDTGNYSCLIYNEHGKDQVKYSVLVQVPPSAPFVDVISKARTSFQLQWKSGPNGGDSIRGYILHYRLDQETWETKELRPDQEIFTLDGLACGTNYQLFLEAFNSIGTGAPCDVITVATEGGDVPSPTKESIIREGATFVTVYLEAWPTKGCPVDHFQVEYKSLQDNDWTMVSNSIRPTQRKLVIPGLSSATWYTLRLTAVASGTSNAVEYQFATHTSSGGTIPPPEIRLEKTPEPVYVFYLDPSIFIPAVALLITVIIASVVICLWVKRKNGSEGSPSGSESTLSTWKRTSRPSSYGVSGHYPAMGRPGEKDGLYATAQLPGCFAGPNNEFFVANPELMPFDPRWASDHTGTLTIRRPHHGIPRFQTDGLQHNANNAVQETTFVFPVGQAGWPTNQGPPQTQGDYDQPPKGM